MRHFFLIEETKTGFKSETHIRCPRCYVLGLPNNDPNRSYQKCEFCYYSYGIMLYDRRDGDKFIHVYLSPPSLKVNNHE